MKRKI